MGHNRSLSVRQQDIEESKTFKGYPMYPASQDIFNKSQVDMDINPEDVAKRKDSFENLGTNNEKEFYEDVSGGDLDVPGSELDDDQEKVGSEDEENHYYSLGGDDHNNLEEENGD